MQRLAAAAAAGLAAFFALCWTLAPAQPPAADRASPAAATTPADPIPHDIDRSPIDLVLSYDGTWLATANQTSHSVSLVNVADGAVLDEVAVGKRPAAIALGPDGRHLLVSGSYSGDVTVLEVLSDKLHVRRTIRTGFDPHGIAVAKDGRTAYVALTSAAKVAVLDLDAGVVRSEIEVGLWPRSLALSPDGSRLAVGCSGDRAIAVVDVEKGKLDYRQEFSGINIGHLKVTADGKHVYFPWMIYRQNPISIENIRKGWVLASRVARVKLDGPATREAISLDVPRRAVADPYGIDFTSDEKRLVVSSSGTHELLLYRMHDLPLVAAGGPGDLIDQRLERDRDRFDRLDVGGRPMGLRIARDDRTVYVANYLLNCVQVVDLVDKKLLHAISLGGPEAPSLARRGEAIFYDAKRSLDQWYSCHSCHYEGGTNAVTMDTHNDGSIRTFKTVLPLHGVVQTPPWTWHGWQTDLRAAMAKSITSTMIGEEPKAEDVDALIAYLETLDLPPNPFRRPDGSLSESAERGKAVFGSEAAGCANCHSGPHFSDGQIHDVGLGSPSDVYKGYNTPSLLGLYRRTRLLHHGRAKALEGLLTDLHNPAKVTGQGELTAQQRGDLIEYLKSL
ncbi:MAG: c-type cytochrome [Planctomycetia bacterium]|nr:c-type cytochrome [Planctomycetia bacterium]